MGRAIAEEVEILASGIFLLGLLADSVGTALMENIARLTHLHDEIHTVTGIIAILLMFIHAMWAIWTYVKGSERARNISTVSVLWCGAFG